MVFGSVGPGVSISYFGVLLYQFLCFFFFFFFSSRRRHTRLVSDWSSDVCSSDLAPARCRHSPAKPRARCANIRARFFARSHQTSPGAATRYSEIQVRALRICRGLRKISYRFGSPVRAKKSAAIANAEERRLLPIS